MFEAELTAVARSLNQVKTVGQAWLACESAIGAAARFQKDASFLPDSGYYSRTSMVSTLATAEANLLSNSRQYQSVLTAGVAVDATAWQVTRQYITRVWVEAAPIYGILSAASYRNATNDLENAIVAYGSKLVDAGISAPAVVITDALAAVRKNASTLVKRTTEEAGQLAGDIGEGAGTLLWRFVRGAWPVLLVAGGVFVLAVYAKGKVSL